MEYSILIISIYMGELICKHRIYLLFMNELTHIMQIFLARKFFMRIMSVADILM